MRFFWKVLLVVIPAGISGYLFYKKGSSSQNGDAGIQSGQSEENKTSSPSPSEGGTAAKQDGVDSAKQTASSQNKENEMPTEQVIEQLSELDGVTSRVAENLVERGIKSKEALLKLSEEELKSIRGIGPKRAARILKLK